MFASVVRAVLLTLFMKNLQQGKALKNLICSRLSPSKASSSLSATPKISPPAGFTPPEPKPLSVADGNYAGALTGSIGIALRGATGVFVDGWTPFAKTPGAWPGTLGVLRDGSSTLGKCARPAKPIIIYEYEASPFCRKVREACSILDLTVEFRPCPRARSGWSDSMAKITGGRRTVPFMIDPNSEKLKKSGMFESDDVIEYLFETYGRGKATIPWTLKGEFALQTSIAASWWRSMSGTSMSMIPTSRPDNTKMKPLTLWGYEGSPFVRPVRETLNNLGLAHTMIYCARGSANRNKLFEKTGRFQVPFLEDPNTGIEMFESGAMVDYLLKTYTVEQRDEDSNKAASRGGSKGALPQA